MTEEQTEKYLSQIQRLNIMIEMRKKQIEDLRSKISLVSPPDPIPEISEILQKIKEQP